MKSEVIAGVPKQALRQWAINRYSKIKDDWDGDDWSMHETEEIEINIWREGDGSVHANAFPTYKTEDGLLFTEIDQQLPLGEIAKEQP